ncbi:hypothetical protein EDD86DRAFT_201305 [Gorgonomyces haynaldii]|nr:hypothetical protein EDD86DRAFT_201305 [Gorgonomyces haynaldii]
MTLQEIDQEITKLSQDINHLVLQVPLETIDRHYILEQKQSTSQLLTIFSKFKTDKLQELKMTREYMRHVKRAISFLSLYQRLGPNVIRELDQLHLDLEWLPETREYPLKRQQLVSDVKEHLKLGLDQMDHKSVAQYLNDLVSMDIQLFIAFLQDRYQIQQQCQECFDIQILQRELKASTVPQWALWLWQRLSVLMDVCFKISTELDLIWSLLMPHDRQLIGQELGILLEWFWKSFNQSMGQQVKASGQQSPILLQVLQAGYPKVVRIINDTNSKLQTLSFDPKIECFLFLEGPYLSRSMTRLLESVNQSVLDNKPIQMDSIDKIGRTIASELDVVKFDTRLTEKVTKNVSKAVQMFLVKTENQFSLDSGSVLITGSQPTQQQLVNLSILDSLDKLGDIVFEKQLDLIHPIVEQLSRLGEDWLSQLIHVLDLILNKIHTPDKQPRKTSVFMSEYVAKISWLYKLLQRLSIHERLDWCLS